MLYTPSRIKNIKQCPFKGYLSTAKYHTEQNKFLHLLDLYKEATSRNIIGFKSFFDKKANDKFYTFEQEKEVDRNLFHRQMTRLHTYLELNQGDVIDSNISAKVKVLGESVHVKADLIIAFGKHDPKVDEEDTRRIEIVKLSTSKLAPSYSARGDENKPQNNIDLYLMSLLGKKLYPNREVVSALYSVKGRHDGLDSDDKENRQDYNDWLNGKSDKLWTKLNNYRDERDDLWASKKKRDGNKIHTKWKKLASILEFEPTMPDDKKLGSHIIRQEEVNLPYIEQQLQEVFNTELSMDSEKCVGSECKDCQHYVLCQAKQFKKVELEKVVEEKDDKPKKEIKPTESQQKYIDFNKGFGRINAGAGSGKTQTTVTRTARLLENNTPKDIIMITFTNKGAEEIGHRIEQISDHKAKDLRISTFNSFGMHIIENEYETLGYTEKPELIDKIDKIEIIQEILKMDEFNNIEWLNYKYPLLNLPKAKGAVYQVLNLFNEIESDELEKNDNLDNSQKIQIELIHTVYKDILTTRNKLEYSDQVSKAITLLSEDNELIEKYSAKHIIVDEFQDTDIKQIELLKLLTKASYFESLVVVGDTAQAIYGFRGTTPENMINFGDHFPDYKDIFMEENFRSTSEICDLGNYLDELCTKRVNKSMKSFKGRGGVVSLEEYDTLDDEYNGIVRIVNASIDDKVKLEDIAIISRQSSELLAIQKLLNKEGIPNRLATPQRHMNNHNIRLLIGLSKYLMTEEMDTNDYFLFEYASALNPDMGIDGLSMEVERLKEGIEEKEDWGVDRLEIFLGLAQCLMEDDKVTSEFINNLLDSRQWHMYNEFASHLQKHVKYQDDSQAEKDETKYKAVTLITAHSSKGLEWDTVITTLNKFNYEKIQDDFDLLDEERRLLFVDVTRAKTELYMTFNTAQDKKRGKGKYCGFVDEIREG